MQIKLGMEEFFLISASILLITVYFQWVTDTIMLFKLSDSVLEQNSAAYMCVL